MLAFVVALAIVGIAAPASALTPLSYDVDARIDPETGNIRGSMRVVVALTRGDREVRLWLYPDRLSVAPSALDERNARWIYPGEVDLGGIRVHDVTVDRMRAPIRVEHRPSGTLRGTDYAGSDVVVAVRGNANAERTVSIALRFDVRVPERFGRLGRVGNCLSAAAPWYPLVVGRGDAYAWEAPHRVRVRIPVGTMALVGGELFDGASREVRSSGPYVPLIAAPELHVRERALGTTTMRMVSCNEMYEPPGPDATGLASVDDIVRIDTVGLAAPIVRRAVDTFEHVTPERAPSHVDIVVVPSRTELVATAPGWVTASDRLYEVFPLEQIREFHDRALLRALFRLFSATQGAGRDLPADRRWADDVRAALLVDLDDARRHGRARTPEELIGFAAFHPAVDQLLYAPQVAFVDTYFGGIDEPDTFRDDPARARVPIARGRRMVESARDVLGATKLEAFARVLLREGRSFRDALTTVSPGIEQRVDDWLATPAHPVNYRLGRITSQRTRTGAYRHRVEVFRDGAVRVEPVEVVVVDDDGHAARGRIESAERRSFIELVTPATLDSVELDPRARLAQSADLADGHPRYDDTTSHPWKPPLLRGFSVAYAASEGRIDGFVDVAMRRRYDLEHTFAAVIDTDAVSTGGGLRYIHGVGPKRDTNRRVGFLSAGIDLDRIHSGFIADADGGWRLSTLLSAGLDTRRYPLNPATGRVLTASVRAGGVRRDDDHSVAFTASTALHGNLTLGLGLRNVLLLVAGAGWTFGPALPAERQSLGGAYELRAFETDELVGRGSVFGVIEHRWTAFSDLAWNALHLVWLREIQLAGFVGGGAVLDTLDGETARGALEAGAGLRFHFDYAGIQPGVLVIDFAVPLSRDDDRIRNAAGEVIGTRAPVGIHIGVDQYF